jgi:hypothetical protein
MEMDLFLKRKEDVYSNCCSLVLCEVAARMAPILREDLTAKAAGKLSGQVQRCVYGAGKGGQAGCMTHDSTDSTISLGLEVWRNAC